MKTHPTDLISFIPGVIAVAVAVVALAGGLTVDALATDWVWPAVLVGLGLLVLASAGIGRRTPPEPVVDAPDDDGRASAAVAEGEDAASDRVDDPPTGDGTARPA